MQVQTARLTLKPLPESAAAAIPHDRETAAEILGASVPGDWPLPDLLEVLQSLVRNEPYGPWVMIDRELATVVGDVGFHGPPQKECVEIGYAVLPQFRRRGYATEAAGAIVEWALAQPGITEVLARCDTGNPGSIATLERNGFRRTAEAGGTIQWRRK
ncbi:MAG TPA: GNAT family N-acetyltransferase [Gaiellaceae bacterium]|nr:GNAT family N-acetyltransferase [Gaiellaceae bacterium]